MEPDKSFMKMFMTVEKRPMRILVWLGKRPPEK